METPNTHVIDAAPELDPGHEPKALKERRRPHGLSKRQVWLNRLSIDYLPTFFYLIGALVFLSALFPHWKLLHPVLMVGNFFYPLRAETILDACILVLIGRGVDRRKKVGWWLAIVTMMMDLIFLVIAIALRELGAVNEFAMSDFEFTQTITAAIVIAVILVALIAARSQFTGAIRAKAGRYAFFTLIGGFVATGLFAWVANLMIRAQQNIPEALDAFLHKLLVTEVSMSDVSNVIINFGFSFSFVAAIAVLLRTAAVASTMTLDEELKVRQLLLKEPSSAAADSLGYFATRRDKAVVFSANGKGAVAYRNLFGVALVAGDPIGPRDQWDGAIAAFMNFANDAGLAPAVLSASTAGAKAWARHGMRARVMGDESVIEVDRFDLADPRLKQVRTQVRRLEKSGYSVRVRKHKQLSEAENLRLITLADEWRQNGEDRGFSMSLNRLGDPLDGDCVWVEALDADGVTRGVLSFVPWGKDALSLDVMRRDTAHAENGVTELMVTGLVEQARELGIRRISLNFAFLRDVIAAGEDVGATLTQRIKRGMVTALSRRFQIEQLYRSNAKYAPEWAPRYLLWRDSSDLATIGLAAGIAEGQISIPFLKNATTEQTVYPAAHPEIAEYLEQLSQAEQAVPQIRRNDQVRHKLAIREEILARGEQAYPAHFQRTHRIAELLATATPALPLGTPVASAGRVRYLRDRGGVLFFDIDEWDGRIQVIAERSQLGDEKLRWLRHIIAAGDQVGVVGTLATSHSGVRSIQATEVVMTAKAIQPIPSTRTGIANEETRVRQRYFDLIVNPDAQETLRTRSAVINSLRSTLIGDDFLEVETPLLQTIHGGANARPFTTYINAYNLGLYLRIAPELYLKRLMVGGVDRVFEIGRNFRNEGADATHNPEFTMLEAYQAYGDYTSMRELTRELIINAALAANGHTKVTGFDKEGNVHEVDLSQPWRVITVYQGISEALGRTVDVDTSREELAAIATGLGLAVDPNVPRGQIVLDLHEELAEYNAITPTFFCDFPTDVSPLTRQSRHDDRVTEKWDLIIFGAEVATAYSELVDPVIQRDRLVQQSLLAAGGDPEAMEVDDDFLTALEYGMPPSGGMGMGVDRLVMMLTGKNIREVIAFPLVKPKR